MADERFFFVDFSLVTYHCPFLRDITAEELKEAVSANKQSVHPDLYVTPHLNHVLPYIPGSASLRSSIAHEQRSMFLAPVGFKEEHHILDEIPEDLEEAATKVVEPNPKLLKETRLLFLELLRASYSAQIRDGELDPRECNGFLVFDLEQSVEFAHDAVNDGGPINDWKLANRLSADFYIRGENLSYRFADSCCGRKKGVKERIDNLVDVGTAVEYQRQRLNVLRALSFIDAHKEAQDRLEDELGSSMLGKDKDQATAAFKSVIKESKAEVRKAKDVLKAQSKKKLKHVISHYLCTIIESKTARYINQLCASGVLLQKEARHYLEKIDEEIIHIRKCPLFDDHPGGMCLLENRPEPQGDDEDFFTDSGLTNFAEPTGKAGRRSRKREKQNSIL